MKMLLLIFVTILSATSAYTDNQVNDTNLMILLPRFLHTFYRDYMTIWPLNSQTRIKFSSPLDSLSVNIGFGQQLLEGNREIHIGIDLAAAYGTKVRAAAKGIVEEATYDPLTFGNYIVVYHGEHFYSIYGHLDRAIVYKGDCVESGQLVGYTGNSGLSLSPSLHFALVFDDYADARYLDAIPLLQQNHQ